MCIVLFLTGAAVLVSTVSKDRLEFCETRPGLGSRVEAFQIVGVTSRTEDKVTKTVQTHLQPCLCFWTDHYFKCVTLPLVCVAEIRLEFRQTVQVNTLRSAINKHTPSATKTQWERLSLLLKPVGKKHTLLLVKSMFTPRARPVFHL